MIINNRTPMQETINGLLLAFLPIIPTIAPPTPRIVGSATANIFGIVEAEPLSANCVMTVAGKSKYDTTAKTKDAARRAMAAAVCFFITIFIPSNSVCGADYAAIVIVMNKYECNFSC